MKVKLMFFSVLREIAGSDELEWEIEGREEVTVGELLELLYAKWPRLRDWDEKLLIAVDMAYASKGDAVGDGQEVAVMPPVQGG
ncbi:MAG: MoaD/ThiS family protein [Verrucomicrobiales bacterium]|nr:MoaD/ThiS family protein [Verrucomicrobiales bacterium]